MTSGRKKRHLASVPIGAHPYELAEFLARAEQRLERYEVPEAARGALRAALRAGPIRYDFLARNTASLDPRRHAARGSALALGFVTDSQGTPQDARARPVVLGVVEAKPGSNVYHGHMTAMGRVVPIPTSWARVHAVMKEIAERPYWMAWHEAYAVLEQHTNVECAGSWEYVPRAEPYLAVPPGGLALVGSSYTLAMTEIRAAFDDLLPVVAEQRKLATDQEFVFAGLCALAALAHEFGDEPLSGKLYRSASQVLG